MTDKGEKYKDLFGFGELSDADFTKLRDFIYENFGINILHKKKYLLQNRLIKRIKALGLKNYSEYVNYVLHENNGDEIYQMLSVVSTNKTDFFREKAHFDFIKERAIPYFAKHNILNIKGWSAGCSSGQELYSLAMLLYEAKENKTVNDFFLYGNDISVKILNQAVKAIYPYNQMESIPVEYRKKYLLKSKNKENPKIRIAPELRKKTKFVWMNLVDDNYHLPFDFNIIFCRNTLIYFDKKTQEKVVNNLTEHLAPGGYLIIGHSESLINVTYYNLERVLPTVYQKKVQK